MYAPAGAMAWELGRSDLIDYRNEPHPMRARARLPLGRMVLETPTPVTGMDARLRVVTSTQEIGRHRSARTCPR
jgi:hypothetical protein